MRAFLASFVLLFLVGCATPDYATTASIKDGVATVVDGITAPTPQDGSGAFVWLTWLGVGCIVLGIAAVVIGGYTGLSVIGGSKLGYTLVATGAAMAFIGYSFPRYSYIIEQFIAQNIIYAVVIAIWTSTLYVMRKLSWNSAYRIGYKDGQLGLHGGSV